MKLCQVELKEIFPGKPERKDCDCHVFHCVNEEMLNVEWCGCSNLFFEKHSFAI